MPETILSGALPVRAFHPQGFFGFIEADGQQPKVAALACHEEQIVLLSLVGYDTSVSAALASLWKGEALGFDVKPGVQWQGTQMLKRSSCHYTQCAARLLGTKEVQTVVLPASTHLAEGILHPPDLPLSGQEERKRTAPPQPRYVLANWNDPVPHERSFLGQLYALRVVFLHNHPVWTQVWTSELWTRGLASSLITPLPALGITAWMLSGETAHWNDLIVAGLKQGWLPWQS